MAREASSDLLSVGRQMSVFDTGRFPCGRVLSHHVYPNGIGVGLEHGHLRLDWYQNGIVRRRIERLEPGADYRSWAVVGRPEPVPVNAAVTDPTLIRVDGPIPAIINRATGAVTLGEGTSRAQRVSDVDHGFVWSREGIGLATARGQSDAVYGLGEKTGFLEKSGRLYQMWNSDEPQHLPTRDPLYQSIPFFIHVGPEGAVGHFIDAPERSWFDLRDHRQVAVTVEQQWVDSWYLFADSAAGVIERYTELTGRMELPPLWALGFQQSRYSYETAARVREVATEMRDRAIPCDVLHLDIHYMRGYRVFTWDPERFGDPTALIGDLREQGFRVVTIVDPGVKVDADYPVYMEGVRDGHFVRSGDGSVYVGKVWPGDAVFPDFSRTATRSFWAAQHRELFSAGVAGIWNDMNEPADFTGNMHDRPRFTPPSDTWVDNDGRPQSLDRFHNLYGLAMCMATREAFETQRPGERAFVLTRAGYAGIQRYAAVWTGDNHSWWEHLAASIPMLLNLGLSGVPFVGADAGGFQDDASGELYARWMQCAALTPFFRAHSVIGSANHEPWSFGARVEAVARAAVELRYSLIPYLYALFAEAARTGLPVMRPLVLHFGSDPRVRNLNDQFMLGPSLMAAPVVQPGVECRSVYLPEGSWCDFHTGDHYQGPMDVAVPAPLERIPLFVRTPAIIPRCAVAPSLDASAVSGSLYLDLYPGPVNSVVQFRLHEDDGISTDYRNGTYDLTELTLRSSGDGWSLDAAPLHRGLIDRRSELPVRVLGASSSTHIAWGRNPTSLRG
ncbi:MAG: DUF5110 domain-containing protein [Spirochaetaceae bacterium]|nr:MAG: DUF5110 domain-containing protein [Spirochaetaceae bacterium]